MRFISLLCAGLIMGLALNSMASAQQADTTNRSLAIEIDPQVPERELAFDLIPLTKEELEPLARAWQAIVQAETRAISDMQIALVRNPEAATDAAYQDIARMVEARAALFERYSMVVDAFESRGGDPALVSDLRTYRDSVFFNETLLASPRAIFFAFMEWATRLDGGLSIVMDMGVVVLAFVALLAVARLFRGFARKWIGKVPAISNLLLWMPLGLQGISDRLSM